MISLVGALLTIPPALKQSELRASVDEVARSAALVAPLTISHHEYVHVVAERQDLVIHRADAPDSSFNEGLAIGLMPQRRESWYTSSGPIETRTVNEQPVFFSPAAAAAYFAAGLDEVFRVGEVVRETMEPPEQRLLPSDPNELREFIAKAAAATGDLPEAVEHLEVAKRIMRDPFTTPVQRAAVLRILGDLPGMTLAESDNRLALAIEYHDRGILTRQTVDFDQAGWLVAESFIKLEEDVILGIPSGTVTSSARYTPPVVVPGRTTP